MTGITPHPFSQRNIVFHNEAVKPIAATMVKYSKAIRKWQILLTRSVIRRSSGPSAQNNTDCTESLLRARQRRKPRVLETSLWKIITRSASAAFSSSKKIYNALEVQKERV